MSRGRSTALLALVLAGLAAYIWFVERKREPANPDAKAKVFADLKADAIEELTIRSSKGDTTTLKKEGGTWRITSPISAEVDAAEVSAITSGLVSLEDQRAVEENAKDLAAFGLSPAKAEVSFRLAGEAQPRQLALGEKTPTGGDMYAKLGTGNRVFLVSGFLDTTFDRSTFELRDKAVLKFARDAIDGIEVVTPTETIVFAKTGDQWRMTAPVPVRADFGSVEAIVGRVASAQMKSIAAAEAADLAQYGLAAPAAAVHVNAGSARSTLLVGSSTPDGARYARDASRPMVFVVDGTLMDDLGKAAADYRPKDLFEFRSFTGSRFEIVRDGATLVFEKQKGTGENALDKWVQVQPKKDADENKIVDALSSLSNLRASSFVDALPGGAAQAVAVKAVFGESKREELVTFFRAGEDVYATRSGDPGAAKLVAGDFTSALAILDGLK
jgi:hypothetical protein